MSLKIKNKQLEIISDFDINNNRLLNVDSPINSNDGVNKQYIELTAINYALSTGLYTGGTMIISGTTTFNINVGTGFIVDPVTKTITKIEWNDILGISLIPVGATDITISVAIDLNGNVFQQVSKFSALQRTQYIVLGELFIDPISRDLIDVIYYPILSRDLGAVIDKCLSTGPVVESGNSVIPNGTNLLLDVTAGEIFGYSVNSINSLDVPNYSEQYIITGISFFTTYYNGTEWVYSGKTNTVDPSYWSNGTINLQSSTNSKYNLRILFRSATVGDEFFLIYPTQTIQYDNIFEAEASLNSLGVNFPDELFGISVPLCWIILRGDTTDLTNTSDSKIIPISSVSVSAGSVATDASNVAYDSTSSYNLISTNVQDAIEEINNTNFSYSNTDMLALSGTSSSPYLATNNPILDAPVTIVRVLVNGLKVTVGNGTLIGCDCYFSDDGGSTAKSLNNIVLGDYLYWNGPVAKYQLESTDYIDFIYMTRVPYV